MIGTAKKDELRQYAKFCRNRSNHSEDMSVFDVSRWQLRPCGIFEILNFNGQKGQESQTASACHILAKSVKPRPRYGYFSIIQDGGGGRRHLGFFEFSNV